MSGQWERIWSLIERVISSIPAVCNQQAGQNSGCRITVKDRGWRKAFAGCPVSRNTWARLSSDLIFSPFSLSQSPKPKNLQEQVNVEGWGKGELTQIILMPMTLVQRWTATLKEVTWAFPFYKVGTLNLGWMLSPGETKKQKLRIPASTLDQWNQNLKRCHSYISIFKAQVILMGGQGRTLLPYQKGSLSVITKHFAFEWLLFFAF